MQRRKGEFLALFGHTTTMEGFLEKKSVVPMIFLPHA